MPMPTSTDAHESDDQPDFYIDPIARQQLQMVADDRQGDIQQIFSEALAIGLEFLLTGGADRRGEELEDIQRTLDNIQACIHLLGASAIANSKLLIHWAVTSNPAGPSEEEYARELDRCSLPIWKHEVGKYGILVPPAPGEYQAPEPAGDDFPEPDAPEEASS